MSLSDRALVRRGKLPMRESSRRQLIYQKWQVWQSFAEHISKFNKSESGEEQKQAYVAASLAWDEYKKITERLQKDDRIRERISANAEVS